MKSPCVLGVDYSINCPAVCAIGVATAPVWWVNYRRAGKSYPHIESIHWTHSDIDDPIRRYLELAQWVSSIVTTIQPDLVVLEDYAFGAPGRLTALGENMGILKAQLHVYHATVPVHVVGPRTMKKFATASGNASKDDIWAAFTRTFPHAHGWHTTCHPKMTTVGSPMADVADAYFLAQYGATHLWDDDE